MPVRKCFLLLCVCFRKFVEFIAKNKYWIESGKEKITFVCFHFIFSESSTASFQDSFLTLPTSEINQSTPHFQNKVVLQTKQYSLSLSEVEIKKRNSGENGSHQLTRWDLDGMVWKRKRIAPYLYFLFFTRFLWHCRKKAGYFTPDLFTETSLRNWRDSELPLFQMTFF